MYLNWVFFKSIEFINNIRQSSLFLCLCNYRMHRCIHSFEIRLVCLKFRKFNKTEDVKTLFDSSYGYFLILIKVTISLFVISFFNPYS